MKRNSSRSGTRRLADELAELRGLDPTALKQRWQVLYRTEAPVHMGRALLLQAVAYRLQERVLGGLKSSTRRLLERTALSRRSDAAPFIPASRPRRDWSRTSIRCTPSARHARRSSRARRVRGGGWSRLITMTVGSRARAWSARPSSIYSPISVRGSSK
jgi:hypothetical protein